MWFRLRQTDEPGGVTEESDPPRQGATRHAPHAHLPLPDAVLMQTIQQVEQSLH